MKISELKEIKIIQRPTQNFDENGNRIYEEERFEQPFISTIKEKYWLRYFAKFIDLLPILIAFHFIFKQHFFLSFCYSVVIVIILGAVSESLFGTTLGKKVFNLKVIDNYGNNPKFHQSLIRSLLSVFTLDADISILFDKITQKFGVMNFFTSHENDGKTMIYVLNKSEYRKMKELLSEKHI